MGDVHGDDKVTAGIFDCTMGSPPPAFVAGKPAVLPAQPQEPPMKVGAAIAEILKREGVEMLTGYPVNHLIEFAAAADIRPVMVRQERIGVHMAGAISRVTSGARIGGVRMQHGPGTENASRRLAPAHR